ncbi:hypothetical protein BU17DRAFT_84929 [Hysterangium stoloniferum]|nr:hypothetical protein BU17DRAFT_84929 [Hysterangium stoloniferum]
MSDAESGFSNSHQSYASDHDVQSIASSSHTVSPKDISPTAEADERIAPLLPPSNYLGTESVILAFLFGLIALILPAFFYFISSQSAEDHAGLNLTMSAFTKTPLATAVSSLPTISAAVYRVLAVCGVALRPFVVLLSLVWAALAPVTIVSRLILQVLVIGPVSAVASIVQFFYPLYVFVGVACLLGAGIGLLGRGLVEGGRILLADAPSSFPAPQGRKGKRKAV